MPDPKTLLNKLADTAKTVNKITTIGGIPDDLTAANTQIKTQTAENTGQQTGSTKPISQPGK